MAIGENWKKEEIASFEAIRNSQSCQCILKHLSLPNIHTHEYIFFFSYQATDVADYTHLRRGSELKHGSSVLNFESSIKLQTNWTRLHQRKLIFIKGEKKLWLLKNKENENQRNCFPYKRLNETILH